MVNYPESLDRSLAALSDPTRRSILERIGKREVPVTEIAEPYAMSLPAISKHLDVLERAGLIERRVLGRQRLCSARPEQVRIVRDWAENYLNFWQERLDALGELLDKMEDE
jgi:DNA-binding transcriptional ArsR family regulator